VIIWISKTKVSCKTV